MMLLHFEDEKLANKLKRDQFFPCIVFFILTFFIFVILLSNGKRANGQVLFTNQRKSEESFELFFGSLGGNKGNEEQVNV